jgi:type I restriction enzyme S subunit
MNTVAGVGGSLVRARPSHVARIEIPLPPLAEQRRIAEVLDRAEALRAKRRAALAELDSLTQSLFLDLFGDPATNPKSWPIRVIRDLLESASYGTSEKSGATGEFPVLRMNNISRTGEMDFTDLKFMDLEASQQDRYLVRTGDVLFNRTNSVELVGKTGVYREAKPVAYAGYLIRLRVTKENHPEYLSAFLNSAYSKAMLRAMCKSIIGMANINATEIQGMKIPAPPIALQQEFARRVGAVEKLKQAQRTALAEQDALFATLQHRAFRGEL